MSTEWNAAFLILTDGYRPISASNDLDPPLTLTQTVVLNLTLVYRTRSLLGCAPGASQKLLSLSVLTRLRRLENRFQLLKYGTMRGRLPLSRKRTVLESQGAGALKMAAYQIQGDLREPTLM